MPSIIERIAVVEQSIETGFASEMSRKRALDQLNHAYEQVFNSVHDQVALAARTFESFEAQKIVYDRYEVPFGLHHVSEKNFDTLMNFPDFGIVRVLLDLRAQVIGAERIAEPRSTDHMRVAIVRKSIIQEMLRRKVTAINDLDMSGEFGLPVTVNAHYIAHYLGSEYFRHSFFLNGEPVALNALIAVAASHPQDEAPSPLVAQC